MPETMTDYNGEQLPLDLDGDPYRETSLGAWKMTRCCGAAATGTDGGVACKHCYELVDPFSDGPANLPPVPMTLKRAREIVRVHGWKITGTRREGYCLVTLPEAGDCSIGTFDDLDALVAEARGSGS